MNLQKHIKRHFILPKLWICSQKQ